MRQSPPVRARHRARSSSTSTTSKQRTTASATWRETPSSRPSPSACADAVRQSDVACRVGGDEFAVILPEAGARRRRAALPQNPVCGRLGSLRDRPSGCGSPPASPSYGPRTTRCRCSSGPTRPSTGPRKPARARYCRRRASGRLRARAGFRLTCEPGSCDLEEVQASRPRAPARTSSRRVRWSFRGKDAGSARSQSYGRDRGRSPRGEQRGPAAQGFILRRALRALLSHEE